MTLDIQKAREGLQKKIFEMVYQWGRVGIVVDHTAPAYKDLIDQLGTTKDPSQTDEVMNKKYCRLCGIELELYDTGRFDENTGKPIFKPLRECSNEKCIGFINNKKYAIESERRYKCEHYYGFLKGLLSGNNRCIKCGYYASHWEDYP